MSEFKRQHPVAAITNVLQSLRDLLIPLIIVFLFGGGGGGTVFTDPRYIFGFLFFLLIFSVAQWWRYIYRVEKEELRIEYGLIVRKKSFIPRHRIQVINISSGILQRMFGLVSLNVQTAGGSTPGATIKALTREEAEWIKETLSRDDDSITTEDETGTVSAAGPESGDPQPQEEPKPEFFLSWKNLIVAGTTSGSFGIALSIVGTIFSQMQIVVDEDTFINYLEDFFTSDVTFIIILVISLIFLAWLLSIIGTVLAYANFEIYKCKKEIVIKRGLFEKKQITIPYSRIQAIRIQEGLLRQPFGLCTIYVDSAGFGEQSGQSTVLFPLMLRKNAADFMNTMVPDYNRNPEPEKPPKRALRRYIIRTLIPFMIIIGGAYYFFSLGHYMLLLILLGIVLGYFRYKAARVGADDDTIVIRYRNLALTTAIVKRHRVQAVDGWDNWFQRRRGLKSLTINIASSDTGASFSARDFEEPVVLDLVEWAEPYHIKRKSEKSDEDDKPESGDSSVKWYDPGV